MRICEICGNDIDGSLVVCPHCQAPQRDAGQGVAAARDVHRLVNLEKGMPSVEQALQQLDGAIDSGRLQGVRALSLIHGYGSSGSGGAIRREVRMRLAFLQRQRLVEAVIPGEELEGRSARGKQLLRRYPFLRHHRDLNRANPGITVVLLPVRPPRGTDLPTPLFKAMVP